MTQNRVRLIAVFVALWMTVCWCGDASAQLRLIHNGHLQSDRDNTPSGFVVLGDVTYGDLSDPRVELSGRGFRLHGSTDTSGDARNEGIVMTTIDDVDPDQGRWFRFDVRGMAEDNFDVAGDGLYLKVEFFKDGGRNSLDMIKQSIFGQIQRERTDLKDDGTNKHLGLAVWRNYSLDFRTPFPEVDTMRVSVGFTGRKGDEKRTDFLIRQMQVTRIPPPDDYVPQTEGSATLDPARLASLIPLGGRWYYDPYGDETSPPEVFNEANSHRLIYRSERLETPFADNMTSWLRQGYLDFDGNEVTEDKYVSNSLTINVTDKHLVMRSKNLPNHPTAKFPDAWRFLDGNPAYIKEQRATWYIPLEPKVDEDHVAMDRQNQNQALPMGAIGVANNGVIFFNPFDHIFEADATWRLDRCCGHPSPNYQYHYHKYPVCVKSPWSDDGQSHSPVIGFAFDGFPVYGPYESEGLLAKDSTDNPLNDFNVHKDAKRGWHYHVTPGQFPHLIGGYWGELEMMNRRRGRR
tara:strand:+ start:610731 stop:612284 length:1554 start_codon:yes stop_codon:yes gene_type:complete